MLRNRNIFTSPTQANKFRIKYNIQALTFILIANNKQNSLITAIDERKTEAVIKNVD